MSTSAIRSIELRDGQLWLLDQTLLPGELRHFPVDSIETLREAIRSLRVRGAPAIGVAAAFGAWLATRDDASLSSDEVWPAVLDAHARLRDARPTAVNLAWALDRVEQGLEGARNLERQAFAERALNIALEMMDEDERVCKQIGEVGLALLRDGMTVMTHCNAGSLATVRYGTALAPLYLAAEQGLEIQVIADETRPLLQGSRLTAWELSRAGIPTTVICDSAAAAVMRTRRIDAIIVGADRVAANGDVANKIGTYGLAVLAKAHEIPFYVAAPISTIDMETPNGDAIVIEERDESEVFGISGQAPESSGARAFNPAFDVTPASLVTALLTEHGIVQPLSYDTLARLLDTASVAGARDASV